MASRLHSSRRFVSGLTVSGIVAALAVAVLSTGSPAQERPDAQQPPTTSKNQAPQSKAGDALLHLPGPMQKHQDTLPIGIRLLQQPNQFRDRSDKSRSEDTALTQLARQTAKVTSGLVPEAKRSQVLIQSYLSAVNNGLNAMDKNPLAFSTYRSSPQDVGDYLRRQMERRGSVYSLMTYQSNAARIIDDPEHSLSFRIQGGVIDVPGNYGAVVAVGYSLKNVIPDIDSSPVYSCSGTLIGKNVVLTAGHVYNNCNELVGGQVFIGITTLAPGIAIKVKKAYQHPDFNPNAPAGQPINDLTVLVLERDVTDAEVAPIPLAGVGTLASHPPAILAVGYGNTNASGTSGFGVRRFVSIPIADWCDIQDDQATDLGAAAGFEFAAGAVNLDEDTCTGDSGGGNLIKINGKWALLGVTSRRTLMARRNCGDGGIYERADAQKYQDWIKSCDGVHLP